jgi:hypothetical protein
MKPNLLIACALGVITSCTLLPKPGTMADYLPRDTDVPGWEVVQQHRLNSVKKIEQAAPKSSGYDPVEMVVADYTYLSDRARNVHVRILRFRTPIDAFGLYSLERGFGPDAQFTGDDTYLSGTSMFSRMGRFYMTVSGDADGDPDPETLRQFLGVVRQNLQKQAGEEKLPAYVLSLSDNGSSRNIVYYKSGLDEIPGGRDLFVTRRSLSGKDYELVYSRLQSSFDAEQAFNRILKAGGGSFMLTKIGSLQPAIRIVNQKEYLFVSYYKQWLFGVLNAENMKEVNKIIIYLYGDIKVRSESSVGSVPEK